MNAALQALLKQAKAWEASAGRHERRAKFLRAKAGRMRRTIAAFEEVAKSE